MSTPLVAAPDYPRTYLVRLWARGLLIIVGCLAIAGGVGLYLTSARGPAGFEMPALLVIVVFVLFGVCLLAAVWRSKVVLTQDAIEVHGLFTVRRLARSEIAGRRLLRVNYGQTVTEIVPNTEGVKPLKFSSSSMQTDRVLDSWLGALPDLDARETQAFEAAIASDPELGQTPEERLAHLARARKLASAFNAVTFVVSMWGFFYPRPYSAALLTAALLPWAAILLVAKSGGLYRLDTQRNDVRPNVAAALYMPGFVLLMRAVLDVGVLDWERALIYGALAAVVMGWAALMSDPTLRARRAAALALFALSCTYGYGAVVLGNFELDRAPDTEYRVAVLARHVSRGSRSTTYYLTLAPWGPRTEPKDVSVSWTLYNRTPSGGTVCVHQGPGALDISWYVIRACGDAVRCARPRPHLALAAGLAAAVRSARTLAISLSVLARSSLRYCSSPGEGSAIATYSPLTARVGTLSI